MAQIIPLQWDRNAPAISRPSLDVKPWPSATYFCFMIRPPRHVFSILFAAATLWITCDTRREAVPSFQMLSSASSLETMCRNISRYAATVFDKTDTVSFGSFYRILDSASDSLKLSLRGDSASPAAADSILVLVYRRWGMAFDPRDTATEALLPHRVFENRKGGCLGVSLIILMVAERVGCPLYGVMLPGHFFARFDNGAKRFNIEPNKAGCCHPDDYYRSRYPLERMPWYVMANLTRDQTAGMLCYNAGCLCLRHHKDEPAILLLREARNRLPEFGEAKGNLALAYAASGETDSAMSILENLFANHPDMPGLAATYGNLAFARHDNRKALEIFAKGLEFSPRDSVLEAGLHLAGVRLRYRDSGKAGR